MIITLIAAFSLGTVCLVIAAFAIRRKIHLRKETQSSLLCAAKKYDTTSQLPDDFQIVITESGPFSDKHHIDMSCSDLLGPYDPTTDKNRPHDLNLIMNSLDTFLSLRFGSKMRSLSLYLCLKKYAANQFEKCIHTIGRLGVEKLELECHCYGIVSAIHDFSFSCHLLSEMPSLKYFKLRLSSLHPSLRMQFNYSIQNLELFYVTISPGAIECILSTCLVLQSLKIGNCKCPSKLRFCGINLELKSLYIFNCKDVEEMEFYAGNLTTFDFYNQEAVKFVFNHVPKLESMLFMLGVTHERSILPYVCGQLAKDFPRLKSLNVTSVGDSFQESIGSMGINVFNNLTRLSVNVFCDKRKINLLLLTPLLQSCPLLQEFYVNTSVIEYDILKGGRKGVVYHTKLKKMVINGFRGMENEIEFALYILKSATSLEKMVLSWCVRVCIGPGVWGLNAVSPRREDSEEMIRKVIHTKLQGNSFSQTAQVILQSIPDREDCYGYFI